MSKKLNIRGKKLKNVSDPNLAKEHNEGSIVELVQPSLDPKWGRYYFLHYKRSISILNNAFSYYDETIRLLGQCRKVVVDKETNTRFVPQDLAEELEVNSQLFVISLKLGFEYLYTEYVLAVKQIKDSKNESFDPPNEENQLSEKILSLVRAINLDIEIPQGLHLVFSRRDIVEHPNQSRIYNSTEGEWLNVHLAWVLSGQLDGLIDTIVPFTEKLLEALNKYISDNPIPGELINVQRGVKAGEQFKK